MNDNVVLISERMVIRFIEGERERLPVLEELSKRLNFHIIFILIVEIREFWEVKLLRSLMQAG